MVLNLQDLTDTLAWILLRAPEWGVNIPENLRIKLERKFKECAHELYKEPDYCEVAYEKADDLVTDFKAWCLRGDNPQTYLNNQLEDAKNEFITSYDLELRAALCTDKYVTDFCRPDEDAKRLYFGYHFDCNVRKHGKKVDEIEISHEFIQVITDMQEKMREQIVAKCISIETNPTSNKLISTFKRYDEHPIFTFYNYGLSGTPSQTQLSVSINTDDQGVFETAIENEYALLIRALEQKTDSAGKCMYSREQIYSYIRNVRKMGHRQSFKMSKEQLSSAT